MKVVVTGGGSYAPTDADYRFLGETVARLRATALYTDGRSRFALQITKWARLHGLTVWAVTANFMHDGLAETKERNTTLVALTRAVIAFPGGEATDDLLARARKARRAVHESPGRALANLPTMDTRLRHLHAPPPPQIKPTF